MRRANTALAFDGAAFDEAFRAGHGPAMLRELEAKLGLVFDSRLGAVKLMRDPERTGIAYDYNIAMDVQPELVTVSNAGIPAFLSNFVDPRLIEVLVTPMKAAQIIGEQKKGDWTTTVTTFLTAEQTGEVSSYGDFSNNGSVNANFNFPQRQSYHYQTFTRWGEKQLAIAALAKIDYASQLNIASVLTLNKFQNLSYFFGISGLQNYGLLNDPSLFPSVTPTAAWSLSTTDGASVYEDIRRLFVQLQNQANGTIDQNTRMVLAMSPVASVALNKTNQYNVNVTDQLKKNFPNLRIETAVEYQTTSGQLVQMIVEELEGQETATCAFTEKMHAHAIVVGPSDWKQKKSQGTWGTIIFRPFLIASLLGV